MFWRKCVFFLIPILFIDAFKCYSQQIILVEKDSVGIYHYSNLLLLPNKGYMSGNIYYNVQVFADSLLAFRNISEKALCKDVLKYDGKNFILIKHDTAVWIPAKKGYFIFKDGNIINDY